MYIVMTFLFWILPGGVGIKVFFIFVYTSATCDAQRLIHSVLSTYLSGGICEAIDKLPGGVCEAKIHFVCLILFCLCLFGGPVYTHRPSGYVMGAGRPWIYLRGPMARGPASPSHAPSAWR